MADNDPLPKFFDTFSSTYGMEDALYSLLSTNNFPGTVQVFIGLPEPEKTQILAKFAEQRGNPRLFTNDPIIDEFLKDQGISDPEDVSSISDRLQLREGGAPLFAIEDILEPGQTDIVFQYDAKATVTPSSPYPTRYTALYPRLSEDSPGDRTVTLAVVEYTPGLAQWKNESHMRRVMDQSIAFRDALDPNAESNPEKIIGIREGLYNTTYSGAFHRQLMLAEPSVADNIIYNFSMADRETSAEERLQLFQTAKGPDITSQYLWQYLREVNPTITFANGNYAGDPLYDDNPYLRLPRSYGIAAGRLDGGGTLFFEDYNERNPFITMPVARTSGTSFASPAAGATLAEFTEHYGASPLVRDALSHEEIMFCLAATASKEIYQDQTTLKMGEPPIFYVSQPSGLSYSSHTGFGTIDIRRAEAAMQEMLQIKKELLESKNLSAEAVSGTLEIPMSLELQAPKNENREYFLYRATVPEDMTIHHFTATLGMVNRHQASPKFELTVDTGGDMPSPQSLRLDTGGTASSHYLIGTTLKKGDTFFVYSPVELTSESGISAYVTPPESPITLLRDRMIERHELSPHQLPKMFTPLVPAPLPQQERTDLKGSDLDAFAAAECLKKHLCSPETAAAYLSLPTSKEPLTRN